MHVDLGNVLDTTPGLTEETLTDSIRGSRTHTTGSPPAWPTTSSATPR